MYKKKQSDRNGDIDIDIDTGHVSQPRPSLFDRPSIIVITTPHPYNGCGDDRASEEIRESKYQDPREA